jgi:hypothetical protein
MDNQLAVSNMAQKVLFECELQGQFSDGYWENSRPYEHWQVWCHLGHNDIIIDPVNPGRNFWTTKDNYNLTAPDLLEVVAERMMTSVKFQILFPDLYESFFKVGGGGHWSMVSTPEWAIAEQSDRYTMKQLRADLKDLKLIMKTWRSK